MMFLQSQKTMSSPCFVRASAKLQDIHVVATPATSSKSRREMATLIMGSILAASAVVAPQALAFPSVTKQASKEQASKERAAKMKEKVAKAKAGGTYVQ